VVQQVAQRLLLCVRAGDLLCRAGEKNSQATVFTLLRNADSAMYHAKRKGKNTFEFHTQSLTQVSVERMNMEIKLRRAVEQKDLTLCFQPKIETHSGRLAGAEALLRWDTLDLGSVPPAKFIPLAEETALIIPIGEWVLKETCSQIQAWEAVGLPPVTVAVNVSARQFQHSNLLKFVSDLLEATGLRPDCLELELTESAVMPDIEKAQLTLQKLSELGVKLSIDDFGTGYSSLSRLRWLPLNALKIDRTFVKDLPTDENGSAITLAIIAMAHRLGLRVVAEGVDKQAQFDFLNAHDCDEVQGYLLSPPPPAPQFAQFSLKTGDVHE
jgi:EAL domain-containing protein (putative c-di-GMP-specific phosphodiesterase class I)